jgi:hypothetical protein
MSYAKLMEQKITGARRKQRKNAKLLMNTKSQKSRKAQKLEPCSSFYAEDQVGQMRKMLAQYWAERLDGEAIAAILLVGNEGYDSLDVRTLTQEFESVFGENHFGRD